MLRLQEIYKFAKDYFWSEDLLLKVAIRKNKIDVKNLQTTPPTTEICKSPIWSSVFRQKSISEFIFSLTQGEGDSKIRFSRVCLNPGREIGQKLIRYQNNNFQTSRLNTLLSPTRRGYYLTFSIEVISNIPTSILLLRPGTPFMK